MQGGPFPGGELPPPPVVSGEVQAMEFTFGLPPGWRPATPEELYRASYMDAGGQAIMVAGAYGPDYEGYWCNVTVARLDWALNPQTMQSLFAGGVVQMRMGQGWRPISAPRWFVVGGVQAHSTTYTMSAMGQMLEGTEMLLARPSTVYRTLFSTRAAVHNMHWPDFMAMIQTWVWLA